MLSKSPSSGAESKRQRVRADPIPPYDLQVDQHTLPLEGGNVRMLASVPLTGSGTRPEALGGVVDTLFVIDLSDSMRGDPIRVVGDAVTNLYKLDQSLVRHNVAFMTFSGEAHMIGDDEVTGYSKWMSLGTDSQAMLLNMAKRLSKTESSTNIEESIRMWVSEIEQRRSHEDEDTPTLKNVVYITDGDATSGRIQSSALLGRLVRDLIGDDATVVHVLCVGNNIDKATGRALCESSGGVWAHAPTCACLVEEFGRILSPISDSALPFLVKITDAKGTRVEHYGVLTKSNRTVLTSALIKERVSSGTHLAATVGNPVLALPPSSLMLAFLPEDEVPEDQEIPAELKEELESEAFLARTARQIQQTIASEGYEAAAELSRTTTLAATQDGTVGARGLQRQQAFTQHLLSRAASVATGPRGEEESQLTSVSFAASSQYY